MAIKAIIWDIGGVLERTEDFGPRSKLAAQLGWNVDDLSSLVFGHEDDHRIQLGQISLEEHYRNIADALGIDEGEIPGVIDTFFGGDGLDREIVDHIREWKRTYTTAVISNYMPTLRSKINDHWQIGDAFDHLVISAEVGIMKPDPEIFHLALKKCGCRAGEAVFIDDFIDNVNSAQQIGMHAIHFTNPQQAVDALNRLLSNHP